MTDARTASFPTFATTSCTTFLCPHSWCSRVFSAFMIIYPSQCYSSTPNLHNPSQLPQHLGEVTIVRSLTESHTNLLLEQSHTHIAVLEEDTAYRFPRICVLVNSRCFTVRY
ncbi:hypothetical protein BDN67DRAFT_827612 [Paxillus ammoniavirescens]|nr:hypothetical protein BDN67DRAFT_827612 [Paxillus ammoniavirescens]